MTDTVTLYYAYQGDGRVRDPVHADPDCHHVRRAAGDVRPVQVPVPVGRDVCGTCGGDVPTADEADGEDDPAESPADDN